MLQCAVLPHIKIEYTMIDHTEICNNILSRNHALNKNGTAVATSITTLWYSTVCDRRTECARIRYGVWTCEEIITRHGAVS